MTAKLLGVAIAVLLGVSAAWAQTKPGSEEKGIGLAAGPLIPVGGIADAYSVGLFAVLRGYYFPSGSPHGVRAGVWLAGVDGDAGVDTGYGYGGEMDYAARFGSSRFYAFVGAGFCGSDYVAIQGSFPGGTQITINGSAVYVHGGTGYQWKRMFVEASYVEVFDDQKDYGFIPLVVGVRF